MPKQNVTQKERKNATNLIKGAIMKGAKPSKPVCVACDGLAASLNFGIPVNVANFSDAIGFVGKLSRSAVLRLLDKKWKLRGSDQTKGCVYVLRTSDNYPNSVIISALNDKRCPCYVNGCVMCQCMDDCSLRHVHLVIAVVPIATTSATSGIAFSHYVNNDLIQKTNINKFVSARLHNMNWDK